MEIMKQNERAAAPRSTRRAPERSSRTLGKAGLAVTCVLTAALEEPAIELQSPVAADWKARADRLYADWPKQHAVFSRAGRIGPTQPGQIDSGGVLAACERFLGVIALHPPTLPCHGVSHTIRVMAHAIRLARRDELDELDTARLLLAAAAHDLGRLRLHRDGELRHADVSAVLLEDMQAQLYLDPAIFRPVQHAVLMHSARRVDLRPLRPRVIDDVRSADKLDAIDEIGFVRALLYQGANEGIHLRPAVGDKGGVLVGWWKNIEHPESVSISRRERHLIGLARGRARRIGEGIGTFAGPPELLAARFAAVVRAVEPDANRAAYARTRERLESLPLIARTNWSGLLGALGPQIESLEQRRIATLRRTAAGPRPDLATFAKLVLRASAQVQRSGADLVA